MQILCDYATVRRRKVMAEGVVQKYARERVYVVSHAKPVNKSRTGIKGAL